MRKAALFAILPTLMLATMARAQPALPSLSGCGGDAFSSAEVVEHRPARRGPVTAVPDTLCADLAPQQPPTRLDIYANPIVLPENGAGRGGAPYGGWPRRGGPPRP